MCTCNYDCMHVQIRDQYVGVGPDFDSNPNVNVVRFSNFYNMGRCTPSRASLITGLYAHQVGLGHLTGADKVKKVCVDRAAAEGTRVQTQMMTLVWRRRVHMLIPTAVSIIMIGVVINVNAVLLTAPSIPSTLRGRMHGADSHRGLPRHNVMPSTCLNSNMHAWLTGFILRLVLATASSQS